MHGVILAKAFDLRPTFLQMSLMRESNVSFESNFKLSASTVTYFLVFNNYVNFVMINI